MISCAIQQALNRRGLALLAASSTEFAVARLREGCDRVL
jgi:hypothetical protein